MRSGCWSSRRWALPRAKPCAAPVRRRARPDRKSTRLNSSHLVIPYAVFCLKKKNEYYKNGGADEIIFIFKGGGTLESIFGKQRYRPEDYIVIPRGITYRLGAEKV